MLNCLNTVEQISTVTRTHIVLHMHNITHTHSVSYATAVHSLAVILSNHAAYDEMCFIIINFPKRNHEYSVAFYLTHSGALANIRLSSATGTATQTTNIPVKT